MFHRAAAPWPVAEGDLTGPSLPDAGGTPFTSVSREMRTPETIHDVIMRHLPTLVALHRSMAAAATRVDTCVIPDEHAGPIPHSRFLERLNEEHRAAIEHARLYTQLMSWRDAIIEQDSASPRPRSVPEHAPAEP